MEFQKHGRPLSDESFDKVSETLGVGDSEIWAVLTVETRGFGFLRDRRPLILFERHIFHKLTNGKFDAMDSNISNPKSGGYSGGSGEYPRLEKAMALDREAALKSTSWGVGQVMGFNHKVVGFDTVEAMVTAMVNDEESQLLAMANFIKAQKNLLTAMQRSNWTTFARIYNGPAFKKNSYDTRLAAAFNKFKNLLPDLSLRTAQAALLYLGFKPGPIDGLHGRRTTGALIDFQEKHKLPETGILDNDTEAKLLAEAFPS